MFGPGSSCGGPGARGETQMPVGPSGWAPPPEGTGVPPSGRMLSLNNDRKIPRVGEDSGKPVDDERRPQRGVGHAALPQALPGLRLTTPPWASFPRRERLLPRYERLGMYKNTSAMTMTDGRGGSRGWGKSLDTKLLA